MESEMACCLLQYKFSMLWTLERDILTNIEKLQQEIKYLEK